MDDGGRAFPQQMFETDQGKFSVDAWGAGGMSLREWFAGLAMQAVLVTEDLKQPGGQGIPADIAAKLSYNMADAMIAASKPAETELKQEKTNEG